MTDRQRSSRHEGGGHVDRLLIITSTLPVYEGDGVPRFVLDLARALNRQFDTLILAPHGPGAAQAEVIDGVAIERFRYLWPESLERLTVGGVVATNLRSRVTYLLVPFLLIAGTFRTIRTIRRSGCVAVNVHWLIPMGLCAAVASAVTRIPLVVHVHAGDVYFLRRVPFGRRLARFVVRRADWIFADGSHVRDTLDALIGRPSNATLRPMGVWIDLFRPHREPPVRTPNSIVFVGRLVEKKGVSVLLDAVSHLVEEFPDLTLDIIGSGPLDRPLRSRVEELGLQDVVSFRGSLSHDDVVGFLHRALIGCVPSVIDRNGETEGMPTVVIEAMASGLRVVGSDVDGIPDVLTDDDNGWLAEPADSRDLASKLRAALLETGDAITARARHEAEKHDWSEVADEYAAAVRNVSGG